MAHQLPEWLPSRSDDRQRLLPGLLVRLQERWQAQEPGQWPETRPLALLVNERTACTCGARRWVPWRQGRSTYFRCLACGREGRRESQG